MILYLHLQSDTPEHARGEIHWARAQFVPYAIGHPKVCLQCRNDPSEPRFDQLAIKAITLASDNALRLQTANDAQGHLVETLVRSDVTS
jgi:hypothetical protein